MTFTPSLCFCFGLNITRFIIPKLVAVRNRVVVRGVGRGLVAIRAARFRRYRPYRPYLSRASPSALLGLHGLQRVATQRKLPPTPYAAPPPKKKKARKRGEMRVAEGNISPAEGAA